MAIGGTPEFAGAARAYVEECFLSASVPRVAELASRLSFSREGFSRMFAARTGQSPAAAFRDLQIAHAKELLRSTKVSTAAIAAESAFGSARAFYRTFLRRVGMTPTEYRALATSR